MSRIEIDPGLTQRRSVVVFPETVTAYSADTQEWIQTNEAPLHNVQSSKLPSESAARTELSQILRGIEATVPGGICTIMTVGPVRIMKEARKKGASAHVVCAFVAEDWEMKKGQLRRVQ